ncbi:MAG TPA: ABC transporter permease [Solirubrobacteraceae bacterium]
MATLALATGLVLVVSGLAAGLQSADDQVLHPLREVGSNMLLTRDVSAAAAATVTAAGATQDASKAQAAQQQMQEILDQNDQIARTDLSKLGAPNQPFVRDFFLPGNQLTFPDDVASGVGGMSAVRAASGGLLLNVVHQEGTVPQIVASIKAGGQTVTIDQAIAPPTAAESQAAQACITNLYNSAPPGPDGAPGKPAPPLLTADDLAKCWPDRLRHFHATVVTPVVTITQVISPPQTDIKTSSLIVAGIDTTSDQGFLTKNQLVGGQFLSSAGKEAVVNQSYAAHKGLSIGSHLTFNGLDFTVVGIARPAIGMPTADVYLPLGLLQQVSGLDHRINVVFVRLKDSTGVAAAGTEIVRAYPGMLATTDRDLANTVNQSVDGAATLAQAAKWTLSLVAVAIACAMNCLLAIGSVRARIEEFGILKAVGWGRMALVRQVLLESLTQTAAGAVAGLGLALIAMRVVNLPRLSISSAGDLASAASQIVGLSASNTTHAVTSTLPIQMLTEPAAIAIAVGAAIAAGLFSGSSAAFLAARLDPMEALRHIG